MGRRSIPGRRLFGRAVEHGADDPTLYSPTRLSSCSVYLDRRPAIFACRLRSAYPCAPSENWNPAAAQWLFNRGTVFPSLLPVERCRHLLHVARVAPVDSFVAPRDAPKRCAGTIVWDAVSVPQARPITRSANSTVARPPHIPYSANRGQLAGEQSRSRTRPLRPRSHPSYNTPPARPRRAAVFPSNVYYSVF